VLKNTITVGLILAGCAIQAQNAGSGTISGTVSDPGGAVIPGASIVIHSVETGVDRDMETNGDGIYVAAFLQPRKYLLNPD
jgi:Carboxypeptidase regulatory-like domain